jgi:myo-inositol-1(or 4)-monophosphatase
MSDSDLDPYALLENFKTASAAVRDKLAGLTPEQMRTRTGRVGQYGLDIVADGAALRVLHQLPVAIVSEESGLSGTEHAPITVVLDPIDGSTNCARGISYFATSIAALDADGLLCASVINQATGSEYKAVRGVGAWRDDVTLEASDVEQVEDSVVALSGLPARVLPWKQYRVLGCASLALCDLAAGGIDGYIDGGAWHAPWDYLGGLLIAMESGATVVDTRGEPLMVSDPVVRRQLLGAGTPALLDALRSAVGKR